MYSLFDRSVSFSLSAYALPLSAAQKAEAEKEKQLLLEYQTKAESILVPIEQLPESTAREVFAKRAAITGFVH